MKKYILYILLGLAAVLIVAYFIVDKPLPEGKSGPAADALAKKMLMAINDEAWQETAVVQWSFPGGHQHVWDKQRHLARVSWDDYEVLVRLNEVTGLAFKEGIRVDAPQEEQELVQKAWEYWVNDSFWLNAPNKVSDPGVRRQLVVTDQGKEALLVTYTTGGSTPGDSYLWLVDENGLPYAWQLWVSIIPLGGVEFSWEGWQTLAGGAKIATVHQGPLTLNITDVRAGERVEDILGSDPFQALESQ